MFVVCAVFFGGCSSCDNNPVRHLDAHAEVDAPRDSPIDISPFDASNPNSTVLVTISPGGPSNQDMATWGGVLQFQVDGDGSALVAGTGIDKTAVEDPCGLAFRSTTSEIFVGNRHGNNSADGTAGSVSRFAYNQATHALVAKPEILGNGLSGVHQVSFSATTGEMFAANVSNGISRFTFDGNGDPVANGALIAGAATRGVIVSPDGTRLYVSTAGNVIREFDLASGNEVTGVTLATTGNLHFFAFRKGELYVAALGDNQVYRYTLDANNDLSFKQMISANQPVGVAFSADGGEMYVTGHFSSDVLQRYIYDSGTDTWTPTGTMNLGASLGAVVVVPG